MKNTTQNISLGLLISLICGTPAFANPTGAQLIHGQVSLNQVNPQTLNIRNSNGAIINWQQFSIQQNEITRFVQDSANSAILNRVVGQDPSNILGQLLSNGRVFLINPNGIVFGPDAVIDTAGLVASTLDMSDEDFINQRLRFQGKHAANISNRGYIKAGENGHIFLIAPNIENSGIIETVGGQILLAAGESITIASLESDHLVFDVQAPDNEVVNLGEIIANGGAARMFAGTIKHSGAVSANSIGVDEQGKIQLLARNDIEITSGSQLSTNGHSGGEIKIESESGTVWNAGRQQAIGDTARGGHIEVLGDRVALLDGADINASGNTGGGEVLLGGDYQGKNPEVRNAQHTYVAQDSTIRVDATASGDGGKVIVWADESTTFHGEISARGGRQSGDGGFVETSGKVKLESSGSVDASAPAGKAGEWLLDPIDVNIGTPQTIESLIAGVWTPVVSGSTIASATIEAALAGGTSVTITTTGGLSENGDITVAEAISQTAASSASLTLVATNDIFINAGIGTSGARFNHDLFLNAGNQVDINSPIYLSDNLLSAQAPTISLDAIVDVGAGTVRLDSTGNVTQSAPITAGILELLGVGGTHTLTNPGNQIGDVRLDTDTVLLTNNGTTELNGFSLANPVLASPSPVATEALGSAVDVDGDVMVVGAQGPFLTGQGAAYVYRWNGSTWVFEQKLSVPGTLNFGRSVAVEGNRIVIGAPETANGPSRSGSVYPYEWNGTTWVQGAQLAFTEKVFESQFGTAVGIDNNRLVVGGAGRTSEGGFWTGKIWFYELSAGIWTEQGNVRQSDIESNDYFGASLDIDGNTMIVGAPNGSSFGRTGKAYIFEYNSTTKLWDETKKLVPIASVSPDFFGTSVSISNDVAVAGAHFADPGAQSNAGTLYVYRDTGSDWVGEQTLVPSDVAAEDRFGLAARVRDGKIVATSYFADLPGFANAGAAYVFSHNGSSWVEDRKLTATSPVASDFLGASIDMVNNDVFLGATGADPGAQSGAGELLPFSINSANVGSGLTINSNDDLTISSDIILGGGSSLQLVIDADNDSNATLTIDGRLSADTITLSAGGSGSGDMTVINNDITSTGLFTISGPTVQVQNSPTLSVDSFALSGGTLQILSGSLDVTNNSTLSGGSTLTLNGGSYTPNTLTFNDATIDGPGDLTVSGLLTWNDGDMSGTGTTFADGGIDFSGFFANRAINRDVEHSGTRTWSPSGSIPGTGTLTHQSGTLTMDSRYFIDSPFVNNATVVINLPGDLIGFDSVFNEGLFQINNGTFRIDQTSDSTTGTYSIASGAKLLIRDDYTLNGGLINGLGTLELDGSSFDLLGGSVDPQTLDLLGGTTFDVNGGNASIAGTTSIDSSSTLRLSQAASFTPLGVFDNDGSVEIDAGNLSLPSGGTHSGDFMIAAGSVLEYTGGTHDHNAGSDTTGAGDVAFSGGTTNYNPSSSFAISGDTGVNGGDVVFDIAANTNTVTHASSSLGGSGSLTTTGWSYSGGDVDISDLILGAFFNDNLTGITVNGAGQITNQGALALNTATLDTDFTNLGNTQVSGGNTQFNANLMQDGGILSVNTGATLTASSLDMNGGTLMGSGSIAANVNNISGTLAAGSSPGLLTIIGNYVQSASGTLLAELAGTGVAGTNYDLLSVTGTTNLDGTLQISHYAGYSPLVGSVYDIIQSVGLMTGDFNTVNAPLNFVYNNTANFPVAGFYQIGLNSIITPAPAASSPAGTEIDGINQIVVLENFQGELSLASRITGESEEEDEERDLICR